VSIWKKVKLPLIILVIGSAVMFSIMASKPTPTPNEESLAEPPKTRVSVLSATKEQVTLSASSQGTVVAKREINVVAQVSGVVLRVSEDFVDGRFFSEGLMLIEIDDRDYKAALLSAKSRLAQAKRSLAEEKGRWRQAKQEWRDLGNDDANDLFLRKPQLAEAQAAVDYAQANLDIAELNIQRTKISVPFNGRIKQTLVNVGQFVTSGTALANIYDTDIAEVRLPLSDRQLALLDLPMTGAELEVKPRVTLNAVIAGESHSWQGVITRTEASIDVRSRMYYAVAEVVKPFDLKSDSQRSAPLMPGLFVHAKIEGKKLNDVIVLPAEAIIKRTNIYTVNAENAVQITPVTVLSKNAEQVWVKASIAENTGILLEKHAVVSPGTVIEPLFTKESINSLAPGTDVAAVPKRGAK
jgi:RND family efflux transporter MFP subunit